MGSETEIAMLVLGLGAAIVAIRRRHRLRQLQRWPLLAASYGLLLLGWAATTIEGLFAASLFNGVEHTAYATSAVIAALWCALCPSDCIRPSTSAAVDERPPAS